MKNHDFTKFVGKIRGKVLEEQNMRNYEILGEEKAH